MLVQDEDEDKDNDLLLHLTIYSLIDYNADIFLMVNTREGSISLILALLWLSFARSRW